MLMGKAENNHPNGFISFLIGDDLDIIQTRSLAHALALLIIEKL